MVVPAKAGIPFLVEMSRLSNFSNWVPAFAGTTSADFP